MAQKCDTTQFNEDQEDLLMSYLNSDYMSSAPTCWTHHPPTPSSTPTLQSPSSTDICQSFFDPSWNHHPNTPTGEPMLNEFPFMLPDQPIIPYHTYSYFHQPSSPPSSSCSSDTEQRIKRRGRKKRDSCTTTTPLPPTVIAPAAVKQLATILPAQQEKRSTTSCYGNVNKYTPIVKQVADDTQKAATIAKRQERLIKNRAAALLSRKRKREHLTALEDQKNGLSNENNELKERVMQLEKENLELKKKLEAQNNSDSRSIMIFMVIMGRLVDFCVFIFSLL